MAQRVRRDINALVADAAKGNTGPLDDLITAWAGIQALDPSEDNSFFKIAGYHGMPFRGAGWGNLQWWGGYCHHGNCLFPTWHRAYVFQIEEALRSIVPTVTLPFWNEANNVTAADGVPDIFLQKFYMLNGKEIPNPLYSYTLQQGLIDNLAVDGAINPYNYSKGATYTTVRYPQAGLVGTAKDQAASEAQNKLYSDPVQNAKLLNENVKTWLLQTTYTGSDGSTTEAGTRKKYVDCLNAPNYTVFSNTTSAQAWNQERLLSDPTVVPLESPHNDMHLAVGGFEVPNFDASRIHGAQGDMGENETAAFDPIFFFHHCWVDNTFWQWQVKHNEQQNSMNALSLIGSYPGTNSVDSQGPTPGVAGGTWLTLDSPLYPFKSPFDPSAWATSHEMTNIFNLGYSYENIRTTSPLLGVAPVKPAPVVAHLSGVNKADVRGSFMVGVFGTIAGKEQLLGMESVLSRWHIDGCGACQVHSNIKVHLPLHGVTHNDVDNANANFHAKVITREGVANKTKDGSKLEPLLSVIKK